LQVYIVKNYIYFLRWHW